ncbi:hypothetical protein [Rubricoccus marinus]|uniref:Uncharacterized protein n=1 Tax=Rubricoccus marinus TaxID=716817 RepID=A0A259TUM0_9BACT|nr:hypothetical protein [Rubricoccus marinus]OZC01459.1 hypothetical protein BSZ36_17435 [Rubricoccus marinus]
MPDLTPIFLSASVPDPDRHPRYFETADFVAIREAVRALAAFVLPRARLVWGGHPAITPIIRAVAEAVDLDVQEHVVLYQSDFFRDVFPQDNDAFARIQVTERLATRDESLRLMRDEMLGAYPFSTALFIGGMEGVEDEAELFLRRHPHAAFVPVATTGAAARILYDRHAARLRLSDALADQYAYGALFRDLVRLG